MSESQLGNINKNINIRGAAVLNVGNPGNAGGTGRPKSEVRAACADGFDKRIPLLQAIADNDALNPAERLKALDLLGKYGGLQQVDNTSGDKALPTPVDFGAMTVDQKKELLANLPKHTN